MTTEDEFQAMLDANPGDWQTRLVFADWLQEREDERAEGYRALAACEFAPAVVPTGTTWLTGADYEDGPHTLPADWVSLIPHDSNWGDGSRRFLEDAAARAFAKLPAARRDELLGLHEAAT